MYKLEYLPAAKQDMIDIVYYISHELKNPGAAERLAVRLTKAAEGVLSFPYACPAYIPIRPLKKEYRKLIVQNYLIFYTIDNEKQIVTIARVIYSRRNYEGGAIEMPDSE